MKLITAILASAFLLDYVLGDPRYPLHPVRLIGLMIRGIERILRRIGLSGVFGGLILLVSVVSITVTLYSLLRAGFAAAHDWAVIAFDIFVVYSCLALKDMVKHARPIADVLREDDVSRARTLLQRIVGRDASRLDAAQIARAAVESIGESFVDGFLAPVFWFVLLGAVGVGFGNPLPFAVVGIIVYRCVNTLDSMVGYRNEKYEKFGRFSARLDDVLNFIPARLSLPLFVPTAFLCAVDAGNGWRTALRDRLKHASPNSAHVESFFAGALNLRLGGPTTYPHGTVDKPWLGTGSDEAQSSHITQACRMVMGAGCLLIIVVLIGGYLS